jgi:hypothetical protein
MRLFLIAALVFPLAAVCQNVAPKQNAKPTHTKTKSAEKASEVLPTPTDVVNVAISSPVSNEEHADERTRAEQQRQPWLQRPTVTDWAMVAITLGYFVATILILIAIKRETKIAKDAAVAARDAAKAAETNARAVITAERPYVLVTWQQAHTTSFTFTATNHGKTPAEITYYFGTHSILDRDADLPKNLYLGAEGKTGWHFLHAQWVAPMGGRIENIYRFGASADIDPTLWKGIHGGTKRLWIWGVVKYRDGIVPDTVHESRFCYRYTPHGKIGLIMDGPPGSNVHT